MKLANSNILIAVCGLPGSGKSYFARRIAEALGAVYLSSDEIRLRILPQRSYSSEERLKIYKLMQQQMLFAMQKQQKVVVDATFSKAALRKQFRALAIEHAYNFALIEVRATPATIQKRVTNPRPDSEADLDVYHKIRAEFEPITEEHLTLHSDDESRDAERMKAALRYLEKLA